MESFDLLISLNAGFISQACKKFLRRGELLLVNDGHYDASRAYVDPDFRLIGAFEGTELDLITSGEGLSAYFRTSNGVHLTREMVEANALRPPSKARFKLTHRAEIYLFRKTHAAIPGLHDCEFGSYNKPMRPAICTSIEYEARWTIWNKSKSPSFRYPTPGVPA